MKKFYSLMLAAGVAAGSLSVNAASLRTTFSGETTSNFRQDVNHDLSLRSTSFRAPAAQSDNALPESLEGRILNFSYSIVETNDDGTTSTYDFSRNVTLSNEEVQNGVAFYTMTNFLTGVYTETIGVPDLQVAYIPSEGSIVLFGDDTYVNVPLTSGGSADCGLWAAEVPDEEGTSSCVCANYFFNYADGKFTLENPFTVNWSDGTSEEFEADRFLLGTVLNNRLSTFATISKDIVITIVDGTGNMTYTMNANTGAKAYEEEVAANVAGSTLTILGFAGMFDVPMTIDTQAKTLTATDVLVTAITKYKAYLSEQAADGSNASGTRKYVLTSTYTVANGKTTINVPNWNAFYYEFGSGEAYYFWPMTNTKIVLDLDLDTVVEAGVEGIAADAEFDVNAPAEYFNLQGIRVATPEAGQLLIKRQGNKATKVVIR